MSVKFSATQDSNEFLVKDGSDVIGKIHRDNLIPIFVFEVVDADYLFDYQDLRSIADKLDQLCRGEA